MSILIFQILEMGLDTPTFCSNPVCFLPNVTHGFTLYWPLVVTQNKHYNIYSVASFHFLFLLFSNFVLFVCFFVCVFVCLFEENLFPKNAFHCFTHFGITFSHYDHIQTHVSYHYVSTHNLSHFLKKNHCTNSPVARINSGEEVQGRCRTSPKVDPFVPRKWTT